MSGSFIIEKENKYSCDLFLIVTIVLLAGIGISFLFSASYPNAIRLNKMPEYFFYRQAGLGVVGALVGAVFFYMSSESIRKLVPVFVCVSLVLSLVVIFTGDNIQGATRWISFAGRTFQPSELVKLSIILYLADQLSKKEDKLDNIYTLSHSVIITFLFAALTFAQNDFSTAVFIVFLSISLLFIAGVKFRYFLVGFVTVIPFILFILFSREHRIKRIMSFLDPERDPAGMGYQILKAKEALSSGGFWGQGIGSGIKKFGILPEAHSDFIFAIFGEEIGFIGIFIIIVLFAFFAARGYAVAFKSSNRFCFYVAFGITTSILYQALMNMAVVSGAIPSTGITLPFFSHGGSSLFVTFIMCGILLNMSRCLKREGGL